MTEPLEDRILVLAPIGQDAAVMAELLTSRGFVTTLCESATDVCLHIKAGAGALLMTEEALESSRIPDLLDALSGQEPWAELPLIILTRGGESRLAHLLDMMAQAAGGLTVLERPIAEATLVRSVEVALRSRRRQYQVRDLLEQQRLVQDQLQSSEQRLRLAMAGAKMGAWDIDLRTGAVVWDARQHELFGRAPEATPQQMEEFYALMHPEDRERIKQAMAATEVTGQFSGEFRIPREDGTVRWLAGYGATVSDASGRPVRLVGVNYDITERKASQRRLERFAEELERQVSERTEELIASQDRLRALATELNLTEQRERKRLAAELHDHLAQMLVLVRMKLGQAKQGPVYRSLEMIQQAEEVINDSLTYTRNLVAELSPSVLHEFGLPAALRWLGEQMHRFQLTVTVQIETSEGLRLPEDQAVLMFQSVRELLINAAKHARSKEAGIIVAERDGCLCVTVEDKGVGFDVATVATTKGLSVSSQFGLFSIRERMNSLGGRFELHSAPGQGTRATVLLPLLPASQEELECTSEIAEEVGITQREKPSLSGRCRVVIADDHAIFRQGLRSLLEGFKDIEVIGEASNGQEVVEMVNQLQPSAVVMDINMPLMTGIEATATIKTRNPDIVVIGLSVNATNENQEAMRTAGASLLLPKESVVEELHGAIRGAVEQVRNLGIGI